MFIRVPSPLLKPITNPKLMITVVRYHCYVVLLREHLTVGGVKTTWSRVLLEKLIVNHVVLHTLWNPRVHFHVYDSLPLAPIMSHINPVHTVPAHFFKIHCIILPSVSLSSWWSLSFRFPHQTLYAYIFFTIHFTCPAHLITFDLITLIVFGGRNSL